MPIEMAPGPVLAEAEEAEPTSSLDRDADRSAAVCHLEPGSYRDRNGMVFYRDRAVFRGISAKALQDWEQVSASAFFREGTARGRIVATERVASGIEAELRGEWAAVLAHARIPFVSYPYEWAFSMLKDAALLHLELLAAALDGGMIMKDSSAYNIQWQGAQPCFVDIPSFERLRPGQPWVGYRQFCEQFLHPLMLQAYKGADFRPWLRGSIDGIAAQTLRPLLSTRDLARPGVLLHVVAQSALQRRYSGKPSDVRTSLAQAGFDASLIARNVAGLRRIIDRMTPRGAKTTWADYAETHSYDEAEHAAKRDFVRAAAAHRHWRLVWDLGCNAGVFSRLAAEHSDQVVAMDGDWMAVERLYRAQQERDDRRKILPLVINLADPSPSQGWRGLERKSLPERGRPELTLCLALLHHIVIGANIPMRDFMGWLAGLGTALVIEFVGRDDEMVEMLLANKDDIYADYGMDSFERELHRQFAVQAKRPLKGGKRWIYFALPRDNCPT